MYLFYLLFSWLKLIQKLLTLQIKERDYLTSLAWYTQVNDKSNHARNNTLPCIELVFFTKQNVICKHGIDVSIFNKYHDNITYAKINFWIPFRPVYISDIEDLKRTISKNYWNKTLENNFIDAKGKVFNETLLNLFRNHSPSQKTKRHYRQAPVETQLTIKEY